ncbi:hypothetical protein B0T21DRAFT_298153, partial [Apiosordaria backusii]
RHLKDSTTTNPTTDQHPNTNVVYNTLPSGTASGAQPSSTNISPRGSAAHEHVDTNRAVANAPGDYNVFVSSGQPLGSSRPSESHSTQRGSSTQEPGYNHLATGTESGVKRDSGFAGGSGARNIAAASSARPSQNRSDSGPYNKLPSGTPSGVKVKPKDETRRATEPAARAYDQHTSDRNTSLPTGPTGAVFTQHRQSQPSNIDTRANDLKDLPLPASSSSPTNAHPSSHHTVVSAPVHAPPETGRATNPPPPAGENTTQRYTPFPNPELVQGMSPEVMPESYRESTSKPHELGMSPEVMPDSYRQSVSRSDHHSSSFPREKEMSPEVMPVAYRSSVPRDSRNHNHNNQTRAMQATQESSVGQVGHGDRLANPALAAAAGAWAGRAGMSSGNGNGNGNVVGAGAGAGAGQGRIVHKCEGCGRDNDISGYVKEAVAKVTGGERF